MHHQYSGSVSPFQANTGVPFGSSTVPYRPTTTAAAGGCVDLDALTASEQSLRKSMNYVEASQKAGETCSVCSFFTPGEGNCGTCEIFTGGPANSGGRCDSWAAKPA